MCFISQPIIWQDNRLEKLRSILKVPDNARLSNLVPYSSSHQWTRMHGTYHANTEYAWYWCRFDPRCGQYQISIQAPNGGMIFPPYHLPDPPPETWGKFLADARQRVTVSYIAIFRICLNTNTLLLGSHGWIIK